MLVEVSDEERLYFVVETKGSLFTDNLRSGTARRCCTIHAVLPAQS
jgi:type III restriction enzyme